MNLRTLVVLSLALIPVMASSALRAANPDSTATGAATSAQAARPDLGTLLLTKSKVGGHIKVVEAKAQHKGELVGVADKHIIVREETELTYVTTSIPFYAVETVWKRHSYTLLGLFVGSLVGMTVGGTAGEGDWEDGEDAAAAFALGVLGAGLGAIAGSQIHSYDLIYPEP